jgi:hypothetical protein
MDFEKWTGTATPTESKGEEGEEKYATSWQIERR